jgi:hypothetical protein
LHSEELLCHFGASAKHSSHSFSDDKFVLDSEKQRKKKAISFTDLKVEEID